MNKSRAIALAKAEIDRQIGLSRLQFELKLIKSHIEVAEALQYLIAIVEMTDTEKYAPLTGNANEGRSGGSVADLVNSIFNPAR
jgi:hypothetical protein